MKKLIKTRYTVQTHVGKVRRNNEDNYLLAGIHYNRDAANEKNQSVSSWSVASFNALFDGLGGQSAGEVASGMAAGYFAARSGTVVSGDLPTEEKIKKMQGYIKDLNQKIYEKASTEAGMANMGTTFTGLLIDNAAATVMHLGDSRAYLLRNGELKQLMTDHTEAERMLRIGLIKKEELRGHKSRFILTRNLGIPPEYGAMHADVSKTFPVRKGDLFLLCSDGLTDMVSDENIRQILGSKLGADQICSRLIQEALEQGGEDNVTVLLVQIENVSQIRAIPKIVADKLRRWVKKGKLNREKSL